MKQKKIHTHNAFRCNSFYAFTFFLFPHRTTNSLRIINKRNYEENEREIMLDESEKCKNHLNEQGEIDYYVNAPKCSFFIFILTYTLIFVTYSNFNHFQSVGRTASLQTVTFFLFQFLSNE